MRLQLLLVEPAGAVDARELRIVLVAAPVSPRDAHQLEGFRVELAGRGQVRAAAHVEPVVAAPIDGEFLAFGQFLGPFGLEAFAFGGPLGDQRLAAPDLAAERLVGADDGAHRLLDGGQIVHAERLAAVGRLDVVIEAVVGRRAEGDLRAGEERLHRFGQHVGIVMARQFERIGFVARGDQREACIALERPGEIAQFPVDPRGERGLGEAGADRGGDIGGRRPARHFAHRAIGQADLEQFGHRSIPSGLAAPCHREARTGRAVLKLRRFGENTAPPRTGRRALGLNPRAPATGKSSGWWWWCRWWSAGEP